jgi:hypothetical protein
MTEKQCFFVTVRAGMAYRHLCMPQAYFFKLGMQFHSVGERKFQKKAE